jgi:hypothetical protein
MKRDALLIPFSRDHHGGLLLAQLLKAGAPPYRGLPTEPDGKIAYALDFYRTKLQPHFAGEEKMFRECLGLDATTDALIGELLEEHQYLSAGFEELPATTDSEQQMNLLGNALEAHIRKEERVFFPVIELKMETDPVLRNKLTQLLTV